MLQEIDTQQTCQKCGKPFTFTANEARLFNEKGLTNIPKKCPDCRAAERAKKANKTKLDVRCAVCDAPFSVAFTPPRNADGSLVRPLYCIEHFEAETNPPA